MSRCDKLREWFIAEAGYLSPYVQLTESPTNGIHVRGDPILETENPSAETPICTCPLSLTLSYLNAVPPKSTQNGINAIQNGLPVRHVSGDLPLLHGVIPHHVLSRFVLIEQRLLGPNSFWEPYISCLPLTEEDDRLSTPLYFSEEDRQWLHGTNISNAIDMRRTLWTEEWTAACTELENRGLNASQKYTWDLYLWAATIFSSRAFTSSSLFPDVETFALLYPVIDCLNHQSGAKVSWNFNNGDFSLSTTEPLQAGKEVFNNYGAKGNEELLMGYGFCIPNNPSDSVAIKLGHLPPPVLETLRNPPTPDPTPSISPLDTALSLRGPTHYCGAYPALAPCLRGIPPLMVRAALSTCLAVRGIAPAAMADQLSNPSSRLVVATMRQLLAPLQKKQDAITTTYPPTWPQTRNQRHAKLYRDGQLAILNSITTAIARTLRTLARSPSSPSSLHPLGPAIIDVSEAVAALRREDPETARVFLRGVEAALGVDAEDRKQLAAEDCEDVVWILWLCVAWVHARRVGAAGSA
ncbi:SET domain-containing protein, partial [Glonium stellatum]